MPHTIIQQNGYLLLCAGDDVTNVCYQQQSSVQRNKVQFSFYSVNFIIEIFIFTQTMEPVYACRSSGNSIDQDMHYGQVIFYNYFGDFIQNMSYPVLTATKRPPDYPLSIINSTVTLHIALADPATNTLDIAELQLKMKIAHVQIVSDPNFVHTDFTFGIYAHELVYDYIVAFWKSHECV